MKITSKKIDDVAQAIWNTGLSAGALFYDDLPYEQKERLRIKASAAIQACKGVE